jgi:Fe-S-cluster containining protein
MKCSKCAAKCCAVYVLDDLDWEEISENMGLSIEELSQKFPNRTHSLGPVNFCIFLDLKTFKCSIHEYRPVICSDYFCLEWESE